MLKYVGNVAKLAPCGSSQANESFNRVVMSKNPKQPHYGRSESNDFRVALGVCQKNIGTVSVVQISTEKNLSPGGLTKKYRTALDNRRHRAVGPKRSLPRESVSLGRK